MKLTNTQKQAVTGTILLTGGIFTAAISALKLTADLASKKKVTKDTFFDLGAIVFGITAAMAGAQYAKKANDEYQQANQKPVQQ